MKKIVVILTCIFMSSLSALELEIDGGTGIHYTGADGKLVYQKETWKNSSAGIEHGSYTNYYLWSDIGSDQAYWPKMHLEYSHIETKGKSFIHIDAGQVINDIITYIEQQIPFVTVNNKYYDSRLVQNSYEGYLYYEYFEESDYPSLGFGMGAKIFNFAYSATIIDGLEFTDNGGETVPLLFFKSRYELDKEEDNAQLSFEVGAKVYVFGDSTIYDYIVKTDFLMPYNKTTDIGIELGYKASVYDIKGADIDTVGGTMNNDGIFIGLVGHFR